MCGIAGILEFGNQPVDVAELERLTQRLAHRGPDGGDVHVDGAVGLGHRRLAIIDLALGRQPMANEDGSLWLVANGEIYNFRELRQQLVARGHQFKTNSDCEVIVHGYEQWGVDVVHHLRGMFAFALWDGRKRQMVLARDRVGIKPLCYMMDRERLAFASEMQALEMIPGHSGEVDFASLDQYLHLQYIPAPRSIYRDVHKLEPGHTLVVSADGRVQGPHRYWRWQWQPDAALTEQAWCEALDAGLHDAVKSHLVADVPFGAFLSGGVDSSTVVGHAAAQLAEPLHTYTVGFDTPAFDEREPARRFAAIAGTVHREQVVGLDALSLLPELVRHYGEPFADSSAVCTWRVCEAARAHVPMVLSGDGGDEVFAGYSYFPKLVESYPPLHGWPRRMRRVAGDLLRKAHMLESAPDLAETWYGRSPWFDESQRLSLWRPEFRHLIQTTRDWNAARFSGQRGVDVLSRCQQVDIETYLPNNNLTKVDIASMAHGLEVRVPLLDHLLLELVARMPPNLRLRQLPGRDGKPQWCGKYILKKAATRFYPWNMLDTPKRGFSVPVGEWLAGPHKTHVRERLLDSASGLREWFELGTVSRLIDEHGEHADHGHRLWALLVLAEWRVKHSAGEGRVRRH